MQKNMLTQVYEHTLNLGDHETRVNEKLLSMLSVLTSVYYCQPLIFKFGFKRQLLGLIFDTFSLEKLCHGMDNQEMLNQVQEVPLYLQQNLPAAVIKYSFCLFELFSFFIFLGTIITDTSI